MDEKQELFEQELEGLIYNYMGLGYERLSESLKHFAEMYEDLADKRE